MKTTDKAFGFPKSEKICSRKQIERLFTQGKKIQLFPLTLVYCSMNDFEQEVHFKVLMSVPKRNFKKAVHRNRIKRLMRENYRLQKQILEQIPDKYGVAFIFQGREMPDFKFVSERMKACFEKFIQEVS
ncbi:ribonuclease P protein component [Capnocytophaga canimorsus]|uniref:ribonuclease P protein component n=1 Tax=Capnocytophaga canimorsus TaxID=28188 RepID=UPI000D6DDB52|nr:ribonuclease P protein component [Capnocytophaga canimorsus]AWL78441.1 ribonuclease P protein component [Capnocytophaga canimorsus]AYW37060.1 ribonuclease P protein component [Capnocytophaga canimorsus]MDT9499788.1 ribonuclease P protein component [Capnocytophaga canimorsus]